MSNNNIDNLVFQNHDTCGQRSKLANNVGRAQLREHWVHRQADTYVYETAPFVNDSVHRIVLPAVTTDPDSVTYESYLTNLTTNGILSGTFKVNRFTRDNPNTNISTVTFLGTLSTTKGTLVFNYAGNIDVFNNLYVLNQDFITYATYKGGDYSKYLYVKISINVSDNDYRVVTISY